MSHDQGCNQNQNFPGRARKEHYTNFLLIHLYILFHFPSFSSVSFLSLVLPLGGSPPPPTQEGPACITVSDTFSNNFGTFSVALFFSFLKPVHICIKFARKYLLQENAWYVGPVKNSKLIPTHTGLKSQFPLFILL